MHKFRIAGRHIYLSKIAVGFFHVSYLMIGKFFGKTPLMCPKCPLTASPGFRRIGRYALCPFFFYKEHGVVLIGGVIHCYNQIPLLSFYPLMLAAVLMKHHAG